MPRHTLWHAECTGAAPVGGISVQTRSVSLIALLAVFSVGCKEEPTPTASTPTPSASAAPEAALDPATLTMFAQLPEEMPSDENAITDEKVNLGRMLYYETRVSRNHDISCNSCHKLDAFGVDGQDFSIGHKKQKGGRNSPTVYNAAGHLAQFWDGRAPNVEKQAEGPILNPVEMAMPDDTSVLAVLASMPEYVEAFKEAFPDEKQSLTYTNFGKAIGAFERKLVTPSRWDQFLGGDKSALSAAEQKGVQTFMAAGCTACHAGAYLGGTMFQKVGTVKPWPNQKDLGRFDATKQDADKLSFKVPSLRNVAKTAPYFHDASAKTLPKAVSMMAEHQLGKTLKPDEVSSIVSFLEALTGTIPTDYIKPPTLPKSTDKTPKPDPN
jgi:cytochrome c peroxidase